MVNMSSRQFILEWPCAFYNCNLTCVFVLIQDVTIELNLVKLNEIDDLKETMTTTAYISVAWTDEELTWNPSSYGNIAALFFPQVSTVKIYLPFLMTWVWTLIYTVCWYVLRLLSVTSVSLLCSELIH